METVVKTTGNQRGWTIVSDDNCPVVRFMTRLVRSCDRTQFFQFIGRENTDEQSRLLFRELNSTPWSLLLIDDAGHHIQGPEAIPFILKNLPSGRLACVAYLIPGTMWITRTLYMYVSRNRRKIGNLSVAAQSTESGKNAA
jgi:predicted DCC family thiol-disulfide oxidoreductase YuxK